MLTSTSETLKPSGKPKSALENFGACRKILLGVRSTVYSSGNGGLIFSFSVVAITRPALQ
jgi:hypothetical protein